MAPRRPSELAMAGMVGRERLGYRQLSVLFNPWASGHTTVSVVTVDYRGDRRVVHRIGSVDLPLGRTDLLGLSPEDVTSMLVSSLQYWLSVRRPTLPRSQTPAPPEGDMGVEPWTQPTLDLDLTV